MTRLKAWWIARLNNDSVRPWVPWYCAAWLTWATLSLLDLTPMVSTVAEAMGTGVYWTWVGVAVLSNAAPIIGLAMRHGGSSIENMSTLLLLRDWMGLVFQAGGHAISCVLLLMFQISAVITVLDYRGLTLYTGITVFAAAMLFPWTTGTFMLCAQCVRKIQRGIQLAKRAG